MNSNSGPSERNIPPSFYYQYIKPQILPKEYEQYMDPNLMKMFDADMIQSGHASLATYREILNDISETVMCIKTDFCRTKDQYNYLLNITGLDQRLFNQELYDDFPKVCDQLLAKIKLMLSNTITYDSVAILACSPELNHYLEKFNLLENLAAQIFRKVGSPK